MEVALGLGLAADVVVPCERYETTFTERGDRDRYRVLLARAATVTTLPFVEPSEDAFLMAGHYVVDRCG